MTKRILWVGDYAHKPQYHHSGDAGFDLVTSEPVLIQPGEFKDVPCGVSVQLPDDTWAMITGRSSTLRQRHLLVAQGIIDSGYRGPLYAGVWNLGGQSQWVLEGQRIAQLIPLPCVAAYTVLKRVDELDDSTRGERGFGSTGQ